ncbi:MAG TPA: DnaA regulatory inactivator Hda [Woeseiaceae bacterium]|nr:DnaA regulatory inactivator Hda [Woeseiaceae bacterium]
MNAQLALPLRLSDHAAFASFHSPGNDTLVAWLKQLADGGAGPGAWVRGGGATGKSHLLQAACARAGADAVYLPLQEFAAGPASILDGLARRRLVCLDDLGAVAGREAWELALFELCNQLADAAGILVAAATGAPRDCGFTLPDLESRLSKLPAFRIVPLAEADRIQALKLRARHRGLDLPTDTAEYLLRRTRRDMASLYALLDHLDRQSLEAQRRLTIPFVRDVLSR